MARPAESTPEPFLISAKELRQRERSYGVTIDPDICHEVDDAINVLRGERPNELRIQVHIANLGILNDQVLIDKAIKKGWSVYDDKTNACIEPMFPQRSAASDLSLSSKRWKTGTVPALTIEFTHETDQGSFHETEIKETQLQCEPTSYSNFAQNVMRRTSRRRYRKLRRAAKSLGQVQHRLKDYAQSEAEAEDMVAVYMVTANTRLASSMKEKGLPFIYRNHHWRALGGPNSSLIKDLYPMAEQAAMNSLGYYSRIVGEHWGLHLPEYCHATSPLRRAADLINHRILHAYLHNEPVPYTNQELDKFVGGLIEKRLREIGSSALQGDAKKVA